MIVKTTLFLLSTSLFNVMAVLTETFTPPDLVQLARPSVPVTSPSGALAVYAQSIYNIDEAKSQKNLYLLNINNNFVEELTKPSFNTSDSEPFFLDEDNVAFFHHDSSSSDSVDQLYVLNLKNKDQYRLTNFPISFENLKYNVDKKLLAFSASVYNDDGTLEGTLKKDKLIESTKKDTALVYDELMVRHWDSYVKEKKNNIFVVNLSKDGEKYQLSGNPINLLRKTGLESPGFPLGDAGDFAISPDASKIAFLAKINTRDNAWQTSAHIYTVSTTGEEEPVAINKDIPAASSSPHFTSSGQLVYFQMFTPQYEADRNRIVLYNPETKERKIIAESWDSSPHSVTSSKDAKTLYVTAEEHGRNKIFAIDVESEAITKLTDEHYASGVSVLPSGNLFYASSSMKNPAAPRILDVSTKEVKKLAIESSLSQKLNSISFSDPEDFWFEGSLNEKVHGWYLKPANFEEGKKYPVAFLIHGGPQGAWGDNWSTRWNPQIFAGAGYAVVAINFHGSTGYGQAFTDSIGNNWGSYPYNDLMTGLDYILEQHPYLDADRVVGLGASYGGFMINWINGHSKKFKALVNHDGVFSATQVYYTTDEIYFSEKEFGGSPLNPEDRLGFEKYSPSNFVQNWSTPTLVIHGGNDFRLTLGESLSTFQALQRKGVPSRLLYFPDENHWVLKPANSLRWHKEVLDWINSYAIDSSESTANAAPSLNYQQGY